MTGWKQRLVPCTRGCCEQGLLLTLLDGKRLKWNRREHRLAIFHELDKEGCEETPCPVGKYLNACAEVLHFASRATTKKKGSKEMVDD